MYYGGQGLSEAAKGLIQLTEKLVNPFTDPLLAELPSGSQCTGETNTCSASSTSDMRILLMDVHTGLGPSGIDTLAPEHAADIPFYDKLFPKEYAVERSGKFSRKVIGGLKDASVGAWYLGDGVDVLAHVALSGGNKAMEGYEHMVGGVCQGYFTHWFFPRIPVENKKCITQVPILLRSGNAYLTVRDRSLEPSP